MPGQGKLWFRRKRYGWGWTPVSGEGWATVAVYIGLVLLLSQRVEAGSSAFYLGIGALTILLIAIGFIKGERPG